MRGCIHMIVAASVAGCGGITGPDGPSGSTDGGPRAGAGGGAPTTPRTDLSPMATAAKHRLMAGFYSVGAVDDDETAAEVAAGRATNHFLHYEADGKVHLLSMQYDCVDVEDPGSATALRQDCATRTKLISSTLALLEVPAERIGVTGSPGCPREGTAIHSRLDTVTVTPPRGAVESYWFGSRPSAQGYVTLTVDSPCGAATTEREVYYDGRWDGRLSELRLRFSYVGKPIVGTGFPEAELVGRNPHFFAVDLRFGPVPEAQRGVVAALFARTPAGFSWTGPRIRQSIEDSVWRFERDPRNEQHDGVANVRIEMVFLGHERFLASCIDLGGSDPRKYWTSGDIGLTGILYPVGGQQRLQLGAKKVDPALAGPCARSLTMASRNPYLNCLTTHNLHENAMPKKAYVKCGDFGSDSIDFPETSDPNSVLPEALRGFFIVNGDLLLGQQATRFIDTSTP